MTKTYSDAQEKRILRILKNPARFVSSDTKWACAAAVYLIHYYKTLTKDAQIMPDKIIETKTYPDGTVATGVAPLPEASPREDSDFPPLNIQHDLTQAQNTLVDKLWLELRDNPELRYARQRLSLHELREIVRALVLAMPEKREFTPEVDESNRAQNELHDAEDAKARELNARRYERLRILGAASLAAASLEKRTVLCLQSLDKFIDDDIKNYPNRGESAAAMAKGE